MNTFYSHFINKASALRLASMLSLMVIFFAVGVGAAYGQDTLYVSTSGSNSNSGQTTAAGLEGPVATITYALSIADEGDFISIETGNYSEAVSVSASHTFLITDSGAQDSVRITSFTVANSDTVTFSAASSELFVSTNASGGNGLVLGTNDNDKTEFNAGTNVFKIKDGDGVVINGDSTFVNGSLIYPTNFNLTYAVDAAYTGGDEFPSSLGTGLLTITADTVFTIPNSISVGGLVVGEGDSEGGNQVVASAGATITINGSSSSTIQDNVSANIVFDEVTTGSSSGISFTLRDSLTGNISVTSDYDNTVIFATANGDTAYVNGSISTGANSTFAFGLDSGDPLYITGDFTNNGTVTSGADDQLIFTGSGASVFTPGLAAGNTYGALLVEKTGEGSVTLTDDIKLSATGTTDSALVIRDGSLNAGSNGFNLTGASPVVHIHQGTGSLTSGEVKFTGAGTSAELFGLGFNNITVQFSSASNNLTVSDTTTFTGTLGLLSGGVNVTGSDMSPLNSGQLVTITPSRASSVIAGNFNGLNTSHNLKYTGAIALDYTIGNEWNDNVKDITISLDGSSSYADTLIFSNELEISSTGTLSIDSSATPIVIAGRAAGVDGESDTLNVLGTLAIPAVSAAKQPKFVARSDSMYVILGGTAKTHTLGAILVEETDGTSDIIVKVSGTSTSVSSNSSSFAGHVLVTSTGNTINFEDVTVTEDVRLDSNSTVTSATFGTISDSLVVGYGATFNVVADSVTLSSGVRVDSLGTFNSGTQTVRFAGTAAKTLYAPSSATLSGTGEYKFTGGTSAAIDVNGNIISNITFKAATDVASNLTVSGTADVDAAITLSDTLTITGDLSLGANVTNSSGAATNFLTVSGGSVTATGNRTVATLKTLGASTFASSSSTARTLSVTDSLILGSGTFNIGTNTVSFGDAAALNARGGAVSMSSGVFSFATTSGNQSIFTGTKGASNDSLYIKNITLSTSLTDTVGIDGVELRVDNLVLSANNKKGQFRLNDSSSVTISTGGTVTINDSTAGVIGDPDSIKFGGNNRLVFEDAYDLGNTDSLLVGETSFATVIVSGDASGDSLYLKGSITITDTLHIEDGGLATTNNGYTLSLGSGAVVQIDEGGNPVQGDKSAFVTSSPYKLLLKGTSTLTDSMLVGNEVTLEVAGTSASTATLPGTHNQFVDVTIGASDALALGSGTDTLTISGDFSVGSTATSAFASARVVFDGASEQDFTLTDTLQFATLSINNSSSTGVLLAGSKNINVTSDLELINGDLNLGGATLKLPQGDTDQGFSSADSTSFVANGYITKQINAGDGGAAQRNFVQFPFGVAGTNNYRLLDMYFTSDPVDEIFVTVGHVNASPKGTVFATAVTDAGVTKYPDFYWTLESSQSLASSFTFEAHAQAQGYSLAADQDIDNVKMIYRAAGDSSLNEWKMLSTSYENEINSDEVPIVRAKTSTGGLKTSQQFITFGLGADVEYSDTLETVQLTEGRTAGDSLVVADLDDVFTSSSSLTFSVDTGTVNATIRSNNDLVVYADTMDITEAYFDTLTITATDGFTPNNV